MENNQMYGIKGVYHLYQDKEEKGIATISRYVYKEENDLLGNLRLIRDGCELFRMVNGEYVRLHIQGEGLVMSDTRMERISNHNFIQAANGKVLIVGLGIGMVLENILSKPEVTEVLVIEKCQDVIYLVQPKFKSKKLSVVCADINTWKPEKGTKWDTIYFDIWTDISQDNLIQIKKLHNRFKVNLNRNNPRCYMNSWMKEYLQREKKREARYSYW